MDDSGLQLTDSAISQLNALITSKANPELRFRVYVQGGGCSGFQYGFQFEEEAATDILSAAHRPTVVDAQLNGGAGTERRDRVRPHRLPRPPSNSDHLSGRARAARSQWPRRMQLQRREDIGRSVPSNPAMQ